jgi:hypothetical protein
LLFFYNKTTSLLFVVESFWLHVCFSFKEHIGAVRALAKITCEKKLNHVISSYKTSFEPQRVIVVCIYPFDQGINDSVEDENIESPKQIKVLGKSPFKTTTNLVLFKIGFQTLLNLTNLTTIG